MPGAVFARPLVRTGSLPTSGQPIDRGLTEIRLYLTAGVNPASVSGNVTVTDSKGQAQPWQLEFWGGSSLTFRPFTLLPADETYTIRLKGGAGGLRDEQGRTLPGDITHSFRTQHHPLAVREIMTFSPTDVRTVKSGGEIPLVDRVDSFTDVPQSHWARRFIEVMHHLEIINGRGGGKFDPGAPVSRAEFAKMLALTLDLEADYPDGRFGPAQTLNRDQAAKILANFIGLQ